MRHAWQHACACQPLIALLPQRQASGNGADASACVNCDRTICMLLQCFCHGWCLGFAAVAVVSPSICHGCAMLLPQGQSSRAVKQTLRVYLTTPLGTGWVDFTPAIMAAVCKAGLMV
jgi:hypothetical protein